jgi:4-hydroxy-3-methylbut-2-en-1-yl diphosphate reductase
VSESLLILVPLRIERHALGTPPGSAVMQTGMGPRRARIAAARALAHGAPAVAVAGLCAGVDPALRAGDVLCASELVDDGGGRVEVPGSQLLAAALRRRGLRVYVGTLASAGRILRPAERRQLDGLALAVDMESARLAAGAGGRPLGVCRVVVDADGRSLADPRLALEGLQALRSLRRTGPALAEWAAAAGAGGVPVRIGTLSSAAGAEERAAARERPRRRLAREPAR